MLLRYAILGLLDGQELHGYRIKSVFEDRIGPAWSLNFGQIYQTLKELRRRGLVEGRFDQGDGHIGRWVYTVTPKGRRSLDTWLKRSPKAPQPIRDEIFMLGRDGTVTGHKVAPVRSSSAILVSSRNQNREWIYHQQQTVSAEGFSGQAFNTHVPHTVRGKETQSCSDCHVSQNKDNNAWLAQVYLQGTNFVNFMGRYVFVATGHALEAIAVTEHTEPQA